MRLFIDDERYPANTGDSWIELPVAMGSEYKVLVETRIVGYQDWFVVRTVEAAIAFCEANGCPNFIGFDHDLQTEKTGKDFANWLVERDMDMDGAFFPDNFKYDVHSQNVNGAANIKSLLDSYISQR